MAGVFVVDGLFSMVQSLFIGTLLHWIANEHPVTTTILASELRAASTNPKWTLTWHTAPVLASVAHLLL